jgi:CheY-like chemotaxis protein
MLAACPVVILSMVYDRRRGFALGAAEYLLKPFDRNDLLRTLARLAPARNDGYALVVEDDPASRGLVARTLTRAGWRVEEAGDGAAALALVRKERPLVVILDLVMPVMDGFGFLDELRKRPDWADVPVLVVTGKPLHEAERERLASTAAVINKLDWRAADVLREVKKLASPTPASSRELLDA